MNSETNHQILDEFAERFGLGKANAPTVRINGRFKKMNWRLTYESATRLKCIEIAEWTFRDVERLGLALTSLAAHLGELKEITNIAQAPLKSEVVQ